MPENAQNNENLSNNRLERYIISLGVLGTGVAILAHNRSEHTVDAEVLGIVSVASICVVGLKQVIDAVHARQQG